MTLEEYREYLTTVPIGEMADIPDFLLRDQARLRLVRIGIIQWLKQRACPTKNLQQHYSNWVGPRGKLPG